MVKSQSSNFVVEEIRQKKVEKGRILYLVKWKDYPESANTWEPRKHLRSCHTLIQDFEEKSRHCADLQELQALLEETTEPASKPVFQVSKNPQLYLETWYEVGNRVGEKEEETTEEAREVLKVLDCFRNPANAVQVAVVDVMDQRVVLSLDDMLAKDAQLLLRYLCKQYARRLT